MTVDIPKTGPNAYDYDDNDRSQLIGSGGFGNVFKAIRNYDKKIFAIKVASTKLGLLSLSEKQDQLEEIRVMKEHEHPFIVKIIDDFISVSGH